MVFEKLRRRLLPKEERLQRDIEEANSPIEIERAEEELRRYQARKERSEQRQLQRLTTKTKKEEAKALYLQQKIKSDSIRKRLIESRPNIFGTGSGTRGSTIIGQAHPDIFGLSNFGSQQRSEGYIKRGKRRKEHRQESSLYGHSGFFDMK